MFIFKLFNQVTKHDIQLLCYSPYSHQLRGTALSTEAYQPSRRAVSLNFQAMPDYQAVSSHRCDFCNFFLTDCSTRSLLNTVTFFRRALECSQEWQLLPLMHLDHDENTCPQLGFFIYMFIHYILDIKNSTMAFLARSLSDSKTHLWSFLLSGSAFIIEFSQLPKDYRIHITHHINYNN